MSKVNLLAQTLEILTQNGKTPADVQWVQADVGSYSKQNLISFSWAEFAALADFNYDDGFGGAEVKTSLKVVGADWWLERGEYDGSEWWEFKTLPARAPYSPPREDDLKED